MIRVDLFLAVQEESLRVEPVAHDRREAWRAFSRGHRDRITGKLQTMMDRVEHGGHVVRA